MSRVNENTVVQLPSQIGVPAAARRIEYLPAASRQMIRQVENRPNIRFRPILHVAGGVDSRTFEELLAKIERLPLVVHTAANEPKKWKEPTCFGRSR